MLWLIAEVQARESIVVEFAVVGQVLPLRSFVAVGSFCSDVGDVEAALLFERLTLNDELIITSTSLEHPLCIPGGGGIWISCR